MAEVYGRRDARLSQLRRSSGPLTARAVRLPAMAVCTSITARPRSLVSSSMVYVKSLYRRVHNWWAQVFSVPLFGCMLLIQAPDKPWWLTPAAAAALVLASAGFGYIDASQGFPIARGQRLQFVILAVITAGAFTLLYLTGRQAGKRWPWRRGRSDDYGAHARRSENTP
jgi:hypothetical protein